MASISSADRRHATARPLGDGFVREFAVKVRKYLIGDIEKRARSLGRRLDKRRLDCFVD